MEPHIVIIGGGLAGLSAGCYARASGFRTTIVEHNLALGGVCTAWSRGDYTIDGCIHWLTGGPFDKLYRELGIFPKVPRHTIQEFMRYRNVERGIEVPVTRDLDALGRTLTAFAPEDATEIARMMHAAVDMTVLDPGADRAPELQSIKDSLARVWDSRGQIGTLVHYRKPLGSWIREHLKSEPLRRFMLSMGPPEGPALLPLFVLGYLAKGYLSRPDGGTGRFRDAVIDTYRRLGGDGRVHAAVDEILVDGAPVRGVRLGDGTMIDADLVVSTSSSPETVLRLLGGRFGADEMRERLAKWKLFDPIVLVSYGVASALEGVPPTLLIDGIPAFDVCGHTNERLYLRIYNDDPLIAPPGHTVVQAMLTTDYDTWAKRGEKYTDEKDAIADRVLKQIDPHLPQLRRAVKLVDVATPLTFWNMARSWRGAYEGWIPKADSFFGHVKKTLPGLHGLYMAGQWVEPGGGVPVAVMSGRQVVQLICAEGKRPFKTPPL